MCFAFRVLCLICGIVGYFGKQSAQGVLVEGLKRLEYRGYDSAGIATLEKKTSKVSLKVVKSVGRVGELEEKLVQKSDAHIGIAHTRWATHGKPLEKNAHPHTDDKKQVCIVHNGIIENYRELKEKLEKKGHRFASDTDSEVIAQLIGEKMKTLSFEEAFFGALEEIRGAYAVVAISIKQPDRVLASRFSSPLILGVGKDEYILASDASAVVEHTKQVVYLEDNEVIILDKEGYHIRSQKNKEKIRMSEMLEWSQEEAKKGGYEHFMLKEILEQPHSFEDALRGRLNRDDSLIRLGGLKKVEDRLREIEKIIVVSCGTSYYASLVGEYMLEEYAGISVEVEYASEFRYKKSILDEKTALIAVSQSGETADTLAAIKEAKRRGILTLGIVNVVGSTIARETDAGIYNHAGPEIAVASTKAFTSQLALFSALTIFLGLQRSLSYVMAKRIADELQKIPRHIEEVIQKKDVLEKIAKKYAKFENFLYLGRKYNFPIALEGALKIKEISYTHAEGYPAGEMKHGPIALIDKNFPVLVIAPKDSVYEKVISAIEEVKARGAKVIVITTKGNKEIEKYADDVFYIPKTLEMLTPIVSVIPLQLFAYFVSVARGLDVDKPRNLAKSVTVE